jgi:ribosomal protein S27E
MILMGYIYAREHFIALKCINCSNHEIIWFSLSNNERNCKVLHKHDVIFIKPEKQNNTHINGKTGKMFTSKFKADTFCRSYLLYLQCDCAVTVLVHK